MKLRRKCPKCDGADLLVVQPWSQPEHGNSNCVTPVVAHAFSEGFTRQELGSLELWVCRACGLAEMYATDVKELAAWADQPDSGVRSVRGPGGGSYR